LQFRYRGSRRESAVAQLFSLGSGRSQHTLSMNLKFCSKHQQQLDRALSSRGLSEIGWRTDPERIQAVTEQRAGHNSRRNFNPFIQAWLSICMSVGDKLGDKAEGCPVCLLGTDSTIIEDVANRMTEYIKNLPDE
jgi:hypothetical protein